MVHGWVSPSVEAQVAFEFVVPSLPPRFGWGPPLHSIDGDGLHSSLVREQRR